MLSELPFYLTYPPSSFLKPSLTLNFVINNSTGLYAIPVSVLIGGLGLSAVFHIGDLDNVANSIGVASAICCIISIALLSNQKTARTGNVLGISGVAFGLASTAAEMSVVGASPAAFAQAASLAGVGSLIGASLAKGVGPTELPQTVAAFHSLVGIAAMTAAAGEYYLNSGELQIGTLASIYLAVFIGGITATGSMVAFAKLAGMLGSKALNLPGRDQLNLSMVIISAIGMALFMFPSLSGGVIPSDPESVRVACLSVVGLISSLLGLHLTASIGGADMPVVITVLNSYSGWALVAEGFLLGNPLLAQVGSLIGFSGAILTVRNVISFFRYCSEFRSNKALPLHIMILTSFFLALFILFLLVDYV